MSNTSKYQHLKLYFRLKHEACIIANSVEAFMVNSKSLDPELWNSLKRDIDKAENEREKLATSLKETIINAYGELKSVRATIDAANVEKIELDSFKKKLQCLWKKIQEFKIQCNNSVDNLAEAQINIDDDLNTSLRAIHKHKNFITDNYYNNIQFKAQVEKEEPAAKECDYNKVDDFCTLLAKTGHTGNWTEDDHLLFLKLRKKHKSIASLVLAVQTKCPDLTKECIINHEAWYKAYTELREKQKLAVEEWRKRKQTERLGKISKVEDQPPPAQPSGATTANHLLTVPEHKKAEVERKKEMVKHWKEQREKTRAAEEERLRKRIRAKKENKENRRRLRAIEIKKLVTERKENSKVLEEKKCDQRNEINGSYPPFMSSFIMHMYRVRDQQFAEKRKNIILSKKGNVKKHVQSVKYKFSKGDESTLLRETKAWQEKHRKTEIINQPKDVHCSKDLPKRLTVSWQNYDIPESLFQI